MDHIYKNEYVVPPPGPAKELTLENAAKWEDYDHNFAGGPVYNLATDKIVMVPFNPILHARQYHEEIKGKADMLRYMPYVPRPWESLEQCLSWAELLRAKPTDLLFAIFDTSGTIPPGPTEYPGPQALPEGHPPLSSMVGVMGLLYVDRSMLIGELGHIVILPRAQRTHVNSHAIALLMHYALDHPYLSEYNLSTKKFEPPSSSHVPSTTPAPLEAPFNTSTDGPRRSLGLRRFQWQANHFNRPSRRAALRMGFSEEGLVRAQRIITKSKTDTEEGRPGDGGAGWSRTSFVAALTWRDWEGVDLEGGKVESIKERVDGLVARA